MPRDTSGSDRLDAMVAQAELAAPRLHACFFAVVFLTLMAVDYWPRVVAGDDSLAVPPLFDFRDTVKHPRPPLSRGVSWNDLGANDPSLLCRAGIASEPQRKGHWVSDRWGLCNVPEVAEATRGQGRIDLLVVGASFMTSGSEPEELVAPQIAATTGLATYNMAIAGSGPGSSVARMLGDPDLGKRGEKFVVWSLATRSLKNRLVKSALQPVANASTSIQRVKGYAKQAQRVPAIWGQYLRRTSGLRSWLTRMSKVTPPMCLDAGETGQVRVGYAAINPDDPEQLQPLLFYRNSIVATEVGPKEADAEGMVETIAEVERRLTARGIRLIVLLTPSKYEVYGPALREQAHPVLSGIERLRMPEPRLAEQLASALGERGILAIDALPLLREAQARIGPERLLYWPDDSHWTDEGSQVVVDEIAKTINRIDSQPAIN